MVIEEKDFKLTSDTGIFWDLELLHTIRPKGKPERQEFAIEGYGLSLPNCMKRIINYFFVKKESCRMKKPKQGNNQGKIKKHKIRRS